MRKYLDLNCKKKLDSHWLGTKPIHLLKLLILHLLYCPNANKVSRNGRHLPSTRSQDLHKAQVRQYFPRRLSRSADLIQGTWVTYVQSKQAGKAQSIHMCCLCRTPNGLLAYKRKHRLANTS